MTALAVIVLAVWAIGIGVIAGFLAAAGHEFPDVGMAYDVDPVRTCLALALTVVFWPAALAVTGLTWLIERRQQ